ncbi:uncharacterized protein [Dermacentor albipictus]|uniref:uncharacterized protein isoform X2 n=1 Tax=Dermacentor albipictus TaxID=60249 RepID=UPI0031FDE1F2
MNMMQPQHAGLNIRVWCRLAVGSRGPRWAEGRCYHKTRRHDHRRDKGAGGSSHLELCQLLLQMQPQHAGLNIKVWCRLAVGSRGPRWAEGRCYHKTRRHDHRRDKGAGGSSHLELCQLLLQMQPQHAGLNIKVWCRLAVGSRGPRWAEGRCYHKTRRHDHRRDKGAGGSSHLELCQLLLQSPFLTRGWHP